MLSTTAAYLSLSKNIARRQAATAAQADVKSATAYYLKHIGKVSTVSQFVGDHRLFAYAMKAYGLEDKIDAKALIAKVLNGGVTDAKALANTLSDPRYKAFATAFNFAKLGAKATQATSATTGAAARYVEQTLEDTEAKTAPAVADALYFKRSAASVTSVYGLLADTAMLNVVETAYGISSTLSQTDVDTQATVLAKVVKVSDFKDAGKVEKLVERYTSAYDAESSGTAKTVLLADTQDSARSILSAADQTGGSAPAGSVSSLFDATASGQGGVSSSLLLSLARLRKGG